MNLSSSRHRFFRVLYRIPVVTVTKFLGLKRAFILLPSVPVVTILFFNIKEWDSSVITPRNIKIRHSLVVFYYITTNVQLFLYVTNIKECDHKKLPTYNGQVTYEGGHRENKTYGSYVSILWNQDGSLGTL